MTHTSLTVAGVHRVILDVEARPGNHRRAPKAADALRTRGTADGIELAAVCARSTGRAILSSAEALQMARIRNHQIATSRGRARFLLNLRADENPTKILHRVAHNILGCDVEP